MIFWEPEISLNVIKDIIKLLLKEEVVAIKIVELNSLKSKKLQQLLFQQIQILKKLNHSSVLKCFEIFTSNRNCYIITQLCNQGNLQNKLKLKGVFDQFEANNIIRDVYDGLIYLAQNNIVHRDLKSANIFLHNGRAKIADFGFAKQINHNFKDLNIGSPLYMAPQGIIHNIYGPKTQVWALGILVYELFHGSSPYVYCKTQEQLRRNVVIPIQWGQLRQDLSNDVKQFILACLQVNQQKRSTIQQLSNIPYMRKLHQNNQIVYLNKFDLRFPSRSVHLNNYEIVNENINNGERINNNFRNQNFRNRDISKNSIDRQIIYRSVNSRNSYKSPPKVMNNFQINKFNINSPNRSHTMVNPNKMATNYNKAINQNQIINQSFAINQPQYNMIQNRYDNQFPQQNRKTYHPNSNNQAILHQNAQGYINYNVQNMNQNTNNQLINQILQFHQPNISQQNVSESFQFENTLPTNQYQNSNLHKQYGNINSVNQAFNGNNLNLNNTNKSNQLLKRPTTSYQNQISNSPILNNFGYQSINGFNIMNSENSNNETTKINPFKSQMPHIQNLSLRQTISKNKVFLIQDTNILKNLQSQQINSFNQANIMTANLSSVFPLRLTFKQAIFFIHYCRLIFKFLCIYKESQVFNDVCYIKMFKHMISILMCLKQLCQNKNIIADGQKAIIKVRKLKQVTIEYIAKYKKQISRNDYQFQPQLIQQNNLAQSLFTVSQIQKALFNQISKYLTKTNLASFEQKLLVLGHLAIIIQISLIQIKNAFQAQSFDALTQFKYIETILNTPKQQFTASSYISYRNKFIT